VFVPESLAIEIESLPQSSDVFGMDWAASLSSLPTPTKRSLQTIGIPEPIRAHFQGLDLTSLRQMDPADERYKEIPVRFHSAFPLDDPSAQRRAGGSFGYPSCLYKATDRADSHIYALRRFDNVRLVSASVLKSAQSKWTSVRHPSIVTLYSVTVEKGAVFFAHAYHPSAQTLKQRFLDSRSAASSQQPAISESLLWRLLAQVSAGVRLVHSRGLAVRALSPSHILLTSGARFRIASVGVADVLEFESRKPLADLQLEDLVKLGCIVLSVAARRVVTPKSVEAGMNHLQQNFSQDLCRTVAALLTGSRSIDQIMCHMMSDKICDELDFAMAASDALHLNLRGEYENGRMLRLLLKLGLVNERPDYALAPSWSETGERYLLQLFRDYLFHQADADGAPQLDMGHVISALNKLDTGDPEQILLSSRNGKDLLVASFSDVRR
jgi:PAB-dependent poly(A)-specific ribonuclease subunit 3